MKIMINKEEINKQVIEAVKTVKAIKQRCGMTESDYAELHKAFCKIHTEHLLNEANNAVKEYSSAKQKDLVTMKFLIWIQNYLSIPFKPLVDLDKYKGKL